MKAEYLIPEGIPVPCLDKPASRHRGVREVRPHPLLGWLGFKQDRLVCRRCTGVFYPWSGCFRPNPQAN